MIWPTRVQEAGFFCPFPTSFHTKTEKRFCIQFCRKASYTLSKVNHSEILIGTHKFISVWNDKCSFQMVCVSRTDRRTRSLYYKSILKDLLRRDHQLVSDGHADRRTDWPILTGRPNLKPSRPISKKCVGICKAAIVRHTIFCSYIQEDRLRAYCTHFLCLSPRRSFSRISRSNLLFYTRLCKNSGIEPIFDPGSRENDQSAGRNFLRLGRRRDSQFTSPQSTKGPVAATIPAISAILQLSS